MSFTPLVHVLPRAQQILWPRLRSTPGNFVLYGGTALALRIGHRESVDFDFFSNEAFDADALKASIPYLSQAADLQRTSNTLSCRVPAGADFVRVSFFGGLGMGRVGWPDLVDGGGILVASMLDLAATKAKVVQDRASARDYIDLDALLKHGVDLADALGAASAAYGPTFNPLLTAKALAYYDDGDLGSLPTNVRQRLTAALQGLDLGALPSFDVSAELAARHEAASPSSHAS